MENANRREDSRNRLRELRKARERESKHFVNVSLDYETKRRLEKAAHDNGLKMTVILRDAIDQYLKDNGY
ncbi:ribbon-helix-helix protein, CopG family [Brucella anthropi]|nr:ribbon-helix-helix protein, CopG family [Brucella anthropi]